MPGGGFVFAAGHNIQADVPPENILALFDTVLEHGRLLSGVGRMMAGMGSIERVETVLAGGIPDRVPVDLHDFMVAARRLGASFADHFHSSEAMAEGHIASWRRFRHDVVLVESGTASLAEACGVGVEYLADSAPVSFTPAIASLDEVDRLVVPDPYHGQPAEGEPGGDATRGPRDRAPGLRHGPRRPGPLLAGLDAPGHGGLPDGPRRARPDGRARCACSTFCEEVVYRYAVAQVEQGAHMTSIGEFDRRPGRLLAGGLPGARLAGRPSGWLERLAADGIRLACHICGDATPIVADMVATGAAVLELDYTCDLARGQGGHGRARHGPRRHRPLGRHRPRDARGAWRRPSARSWPVLAPGGGLILGPGCALPPETPAENIEALVAAAERWGRYRPDGSLAA